MEEKDLRNAYLEANGRIRRMFIHILTEFADLELHVKTGRQSNALKAIDYLKKDIAYLENYIHEYQELTDANFSTPTLKLKPTEQIKCFDRYIKNQENE